jgi:hypothetical protein
LGTKITKFLNDGLASKTSAGPLNLMKDELNSGNEPLYGSYPYRSSCF